MKIERIRRDDTGPNPGVAQLSGGEQQMLAIGRALTGRHGMRSKFGMCVDVTSQTRRSVA